MIELVNEVGSSLMAAVFLIVLIAALALGQT